MREYSSTRENFLSKLKRSGEVLIIVTGRKTKKKFSTPVWFLLEGEDKKEKVLLVPIKGSDSNWFKNLVEDARIRLGVADSTIESEATLVRDRNQVKQLIDKLKAKYESEWSESYYTKRDAYVEVPV